MRLYKATLAWRNIHRYGTRLHIRSIINPEKIEVQWNTWIYSLLPSRDTDATVVYDFHRSSVTPFLQLFLPSRPSSCAALACQLFSPHWSDT